MFLNLGYFGDNHVNFWFGLGSLKSPDIFLELEFSIHARDGRYQLSWFRYVTRPIPFFVNTDTKIETDTHFPPLLNERFKQE